MRRRSAGDRPRRGPPLGRSQPIAIRQLGPPLSNPLAAAAHLNHAALGRARGDGELPRVLPRQCRTSQPERNSPCPNSLRLAASWSASTARSTGRDAIALADRLCAPSGRLTLANIVLMPSPTYHNFHATPAWRARREMLERERDAHRGGRRADRYVRPLGGQWAAPAGYRLRRRPAGRGVVFPGPRRARTGRRRRPRDRERCGCPVAVAPHGYAEQSDEIYEPLASRYDGGAEADAALAVAREVASAHGARLLALTVVTPLAGAAERCADARAKRRVIRCGNSKESRGGSPSARPRRAHRFRRRARPARRGVTRPRAAPAPDFRKHLPAPDPRSALPAAGHSSVCRRRARARADGLTAAGEPAAWRSARGR